MLTLVSWKCSRHGCEPCTPSASKTDLRVPLIRIVEHAVAAQLFQTVPDGMPNTLLKANTNVIGDQFYYQFYVFNYLQKDLFHTIVMNCYYSSRIIAITLYEHKHDTLTDSQLRDKIKFSSARFSSYKAASYLGNCCLIVI